MTANSPRLPRLLLALFVLLVASSVGGFCGWAGISLYGRATEGEIRLSQSIGAAAGCFTGWLWLIAVRPFINKGKAGQIIVAGAGFGMAAGFLAAAIHGLMLRQLFRPTSLEGILEVAIVFGLSGGFIVGFVCGLAARYAVNWGQRRE